MACEPPIADYEVLGGFFASLAELQERGIGRPLWSVLSADEAATLLRLGVRPSPLPVEDFRDAGPVARARED